MSFHPSIAVPIPGLPSLATQVAAWHASVARAGTHPVSVASPQVRKPYPKRRSAAWSGKGIESAIMRVVGKRTVHLHDLYGAMPTAPIASIKACLTHLVEAGLLLRPAKAHYRRAAP